MKERSCDKWTSSCRKPGCWTETEVSLQSEEWILRLLRSRHYKNRDGHWHEGFRLAVNCWQIVRVLFSEQHAGPVAKHKTWITFTKNKNKLRATPCNWMAHSALNEWLSCLVWRKQAILQSSLAQGYSMSQTIPGQRLHAVMKHGWHVSGSNVSHSRTDRQPDGWTSSHKLLYTQSCTQVKKWDSCSMIKSMRWKAVSRHGHI